MNNSESLFFEYRYLVYEIVNGFNPNKYDMEELTDIGICTLLKEAQEYENVNGIDFQTYAKFCIRNGINQYVNSIELNRNSLI